MFNPELLYSIAIFGLSFLLLFFIWKKVTGAGNKESLEDKRNQLIKRREQLKVPYADCKIIAYSGGPIDIANQKNMNTPTDLFFIDIPEHLNKKPNKSVIEYMITKHGEKCAFYSPVIFKDTNTLRSLMDEQQFGQVYFDIRSGDYVFEVDGFGEVFERKIPVSCKVQVKR